MAAPTELPGVTHRYHDLDTGVRAHVAHAGPPDAPAVVALNGFPQHWYEWRRVIAILKDEFRVLAMDTRGLGWSGPAPDGDYRKARIAEDARALLDDLHIENALLLGHDWGGWAGWHAALNDPDRWRGYVATGIGHPWISPAAGHKTLPRLAYQPPIAAPVLGPRIIPALVPHILRAAWGDKETYDKAAEEIYAAPYRKTAEAASSYYRQYLTHEVARGPHGRLQIPTRLLNGTNDPIGTAAAKGLERHGDDARVTFLEGCGHFVPEERPADVAAAVGELSAG
jgi:pimeloyl-ACP methyl ester carboxylesterase